MRRRAHAIAVSLVTALALATLGGAAPRSSALAGTSSYVVGGTGQPTWTLDSAQLTDLAQMAEQDGSTLDEAIMAYGWREPFSQLVNEIREAHPDAFATSGVDGRIEGPWVAFAATAPPAAVDLLAGFTLPITVVEGMGYNEQEIGDLTVDVHYRLSESPLLAEIGTGADDAGTIIVSVVPADPDIDEADLVEDLRELLAPAQRERVVIEVVADAGGFD